MTAAQLALEPVEATRTNGTWRMWWRVTNESGGEVRLVSARAPHARFRAEPTDVDLALTTSGRLELKVRVEAAPGEEIADASLVVIARHDHETWRYVFSLRVRLDEHGTPWPIVGPLRVERVGLAGEA